MEEVSEFKHVLHLDRLELNLENIFSFELPYNQKLTEDHHFIKFDRISTSYYECQDRKGYRLCFKVFLDEILIGELLINSKFKGDMVCFEFNRRVLYSKSRNYWYDVLKTLKEELGLSFHGIHYLEIALDSTKPFREEISHCYHNSTDHDECTKPLYSSKYKMNINTFNNNSTYTNGGKSMYVEIYNKGNKSEDFIDDFFLENGFTENEIKVINRLELKMRRSFISNQKCKKNGLRIDLETLRDQEMLTSLYSFFTRKKVTFNVLSTQKFNSSRNSTFDEISLLDDIELADTPPVRYLPNDPVKSTFYKGGNCKKKIIRQVYDLYLENPNRNVLSQIYMNARSMSLSHRELIQIVSEQSCACGRKAPDMALKYLTRRYKRDRCISDIIRIPMKIMNWVGTMVV